ncbi:MAG: YdcF family protein [Betaproteobacteria bacterium]|nr:YdcF family protein [Betaproteobacteria bacterium]
MFLLKKLLTALVLPPTGLLVLAFFGLWLAGRKSLPWRNAGIALASLSLLGLFALSLPIVGNSLLAGLESAPPISHGELAGSQAIVILGGGSYVGAPEYAGDTVNGATLERLRYGARLERESGLPLLVTSGAPWGGRPEAESMKDVLEGEFGVPVRWAEGRSRDTAENARLSAPMLKAEGITRIALVSHGWHLPRAVPLFEREGLTVVAAPTVFSTGSPSLVENLLPGEGFGRSREALHEYLGLLANRLAGML